MFEEKHNILLDQKVEEQARYLDNTHSLLAYGKIPSSLFLLAQTLSFYCRNFIRIFALSIFYFLIVADTFIVQLFYISNPLIALAFPLLMLAYICTIANLVLEEENTIFACSKYALAKLLPVFYSLVIFIAVICGFAVLALIPEIAFLYFFPNSNSLKIFGGILFAIFLISLVVWYSLFLFVAVDESKYGFKSLFRSKVYVSVNFADFLKRLVVCVAMVPVIFTVMLSVMQGILNGVDFFNNYFEIKYVFDLPDIIKAKLLSYKIDFMEQEYLLKDWFIKIVFLIPFITIYLGFLYSTLSCENPLPPAFSSSIIHKTLLAIFFIVGLLVIIFLSYKFLSPYQSLNLQELSRGWKF